MDTQTPTEEPILCPQQNPDSLCESCRSIDFDAILSQQYDYSEVVPLMSPGHLPSGDCALCQMFDQYRGDHLVSGVLCSIPWKHTTVGLSEGLGETQSQGRMLRVLPVDHIHNIEAFFRQRGHISEPADTPLPWSEGPPGPRSVDPEVIDYSMIRSWLDSCRNHSAPSFCKPSEVDSDWPVRFIDCETRLVVEAASLRSPCPPFLALSYVWGKPVDLQYRQPAHGEPLQDVPLTVEDSIVVTQKLGFRYLWVDKYCIRQDDEGDKLRQVPLMAEIYGLAQITIIAAAGSNPSYGLPGVSRPRKVHQPQARVGKYTLIWAWGSDSVREDIASSVWLTRGWTYQEGLLSTRRLVFTDRQIYFQCNTSGFYETFKMPSDLHDSMRKDLEFPPMHRDLVQDWDIGNRIHEYTRRKLGNEADILNAFQGVFRVFSEPPTLVHNVWGIPISSHYWDGAQPRHSHDRFLANLCWTLETPADRRDKFPSWSWAGWKGVVKLEYTQTLFNLASNDTDITVSFESPDGTRAKWSQLEPILGVLGIIGSQDYHRTLVLDCPSFPLQVEEAHDEGDAHGPASMRSPGTDAKTGLRVSGDVAGHFYPLCKRPSWGPDRPQQDRIIGVPMSLSISRGTGYKPRRLFAMVVQKKTEFWERVGHFEWSNPEGETDFPTFFSTIRTTRTVLRIA